MKQILTAAVVFCTIVALVTFAIVASFGHVQDVGATVCGDPGVPAYPNCWTWTPTRTPAVTQTPYVITATPGVCTPEPTRTPRPTRTPTASPSSTATQTATPPVSTPEATETAKPRGPIGGPDTGNGGFVCQNEED
jgi:hypothetical protein